MLSGIGNRLHQLPPRSRMRGSSASGMRRSPSSALWAAAGQRVGLDPAVVAVLHFFRENLAACGNNGSPIMTRAGQSRCGLRRVAELMVVVSRQVLPDLLSFVKKQSCTVSE
ncbi:MAG: hypothetical protein CM15mP84_00510 [Cellvibrionales bacterium]|nr:MAG: hypothetical protein CM15mP84_00510 [Cellvibrionales bacterium]